MRMESGSEAAQIQPPVDALFNGLWLLSHRRMDFLVSVFQSDPGLHGLEVCPWPCMSWESHSTQTLGGERTYGSDLDFIYYPWCCVTIFEELWKLCDQIWTAHVEPQYESGGSAKSVPLMSLNTADLSQDENWITLVRTGEIVQAWSGGRGQMVPNGRNTQRHICDCDKWWRYFLETIQWLKQYKVNLLFFFSLKPDAATITSF